VRGRLRAASVLLAALAVNAAVWVLALAGHAAGLPLQRLAAEFLSTTAIVLMSANAVIATRPFVLDRLYRGLDKLFVSHRVDGVAVACLVLGHFLLMPKTPGWTAAKLIALPNITLLLISIALAIAPRSPWRELTKRLRYDQWKAEHRFMGVFLGAALVHSLLAHPIAYAFAPTRLWVQGVAVLGLLAYAYRELAERFVRERYRYEVAATSHPAAGILEVRLAPSPGPVLRHRAGQFAFVRFDAGPSHEQHHFTLSAAPVADGTLRYTIHSSGDWTRALHAGLPAGSAARLEGPYGGFDWRRGGGRQLWVAGGIGITPFLAFLGDEALDREVLLVWSVRDLAEAPCVEELRAHAAAHEHVEVRIHESGRQGQLSVAGLELERPSELSAFLCGPVPMREALRAQLRAAGVPDRAIFWEEFSLR
jgi:predicted ferric reductase